MSFVGLHIHSDYSLLDGASQIPQLVDRVAALGMPAVALTDHGVMYGAIELIKVCKSKGVKPIIGNEMYVINGDITKQERRPRYHQVVLAKNTQGYKNLVKLTTLSHLQGVQGKGIFSRPCISKELIEQYHEGLIMTSACLGGEIPQALLQGRPEIARKVARWYKDLLGDDYYLEIQDHGIPEERIVNPEIVRIAEELDIKIVVTNDSHYISCNDVEAHDALLCIQTGKLISEEKRLRYTGTEYVKSADEMRQLFRDHLPQDVVDRAVETTLEVAAKVEEYNILGEPRIPNYPIPEGLTAFEYMVEVARQGMLERFNCKSYEEIEPHYRERLEYELNMLDRMGFATYFLVVWDYIKFARDNGIPVGPGRGCVLGETEVLLADGREIAIQDIEIGMQVVTHQGNLQTVTNKMVYDCDEEIVTLKIASEELSLTQDHKIWAVQTQNCTVNSAKTIDVVCKPTYRRYCTEKPYQNYQLNWIPAGELQKDDFVVFPRVRSKEQEITFDIVQYVDQKQHLRYDEESVWYEIGSNELATKKVPRFISYDENFARLLGYYIAEGWSRLGVRECTVGFGFNSGETHYVEEVSQLLKQVFHLTSQQVPHADKNSTQVLAYSRLVGEFLTALCGRGANCKQIPGEIIQQGKTEYTKILVAYMFRGDGHAGTKEKTTVVKYTTTSPTLASQLRLLFARFGYWASIIKYKKPYENWAIEHSVKLAGEQLLNWNADFLDYPIGIKPQKFFRNERFFLDEQYIYVKIRSVTRSPYTGKVYDISVPPDTSYVANSIAIHNSAAGSLVAYAMRITNIDPVHHGLLFERFLNPERRSMPDVDTDFCIDRRDEVIQYVTEKYGTDHVAQIITYNRMTSKAVLKDVARVLNVPYNEADKMAKLIPVVRGKPTKLAKMIAEDTPAPEFREKYLNDETVRHWLDMAMRIEGTNKSVGIHAAGVVISADPLDEIVPLQRNADGNVFTQYFMEDIESLGLLKMDFLGLKNLTMIQKAVDLIQQTHQEQIDLDRLPLDDRNSYELLARGELEGIFQLESSGMRQIVRDLKPSGLEDISSVLALYRPGPLDAGLIPKFINRKHGRERIEYDHQILEPILNETYGIMVYQEQIMKIAQDMAGYSLGQADLLRRSMGKKKKSEMEKHQEIFVQGAEKNGVNPQIATTLFEQMVLFAEYCFNKSHSTAYGYVTYQTAYLKANYPVEYMAALLTINSDAQDKVQKYIATCQTMGITIEPPDINRSGVDFTPLSDSILFGLSAVRNVGLGAIENILQARESSGQFKSLADLCDRIDPRTVNRRALEALIQCGALDTLNPNRRQLTADLDYVLDWAQSRARDREVGQGNLFDLMMGGSSDSSSSASSGFESAPKAPTVEDYPPQEKLKLEKELLGFYISDHPLKSVQQAAQVLAPISLSDLALKQEGMTVSAIAMISSIKPVTTKKGDRMAILTIEDLTGQADAVVFPKSYQRISEYLQVDARLMIWGKIDKRDDRPPQLLVDDVEPVEEVRMITVELTPDIAKDYAHCNQLRDILRQQHDEVQAEARIPVIAIVSGGDRREIVRLGKQFCVIDQEATVMALRQAGFQANAQSLVSA